MYVVCGLSSARTQGSAPPNSSLLTKRKANTSATTNSGSGGVDETQFKKAFLMYLKLMWVSVRIGTCIYSF